MKKSIPENKPNHVKQRSIENTTYGIRQAIQSSYFNLKSRKKKIDSDIHAESLYMGTPTIIQWNA